jgi:hypothetical protein
MEQRHIVIVVDRDGTGIYNSRDHVFLSTDADRTEHIILFLYGIEGLTVLTTLLQAAIYIISDYPEWRSAIFLRLTLARGHDVGPGVLTRIAT